MSRYIIEAAVFKLPVPFCRISHNFWILRDESNQQIVAYLHGLATSRRTGKILPIGYSSDHSLRAHHIVEDKQFASEHGFAVGTFFLPCHGSTRIYDKADALERWLKAVSAINQINTLNLDYPRCGFRVPLIETVNSNSIYHTFADIMEIEPYRFPGYIHVGLAKSIIKLIKPGLT